MSPRGVNRFNQREVTRAVRALRLAGESVDRVEITPRSGKISLVLGKPAEASGNNSWDEVLTDAADEKRTA